MANIKTFNEKNYFKGRYSDLESKDPGPPQVNQLLDTWFFVR